jgi:hypothetical protein
MVDFKFRFYKTKGFVPNVVRDMIGTIRSRDGKIIGYSRLVKKSDFKECGFDELLKNLDKYFSIRFTLPFKIVPFAELFMSVEPNERTLTITVEGYTPFSSTRLADFDRSRGDLQKSAIHNLELFIEFLKDLYKVTEPAFGYGLPEESGVSPEKWSQLEVTDIGELMIFGPRYVKKYDMLKLDSKVFWKFEKLRDSGVAIVPAPLRIDWDAKKLENASQQLFQVFGIDPNKSEWVHGKGTPIIN